MKERMFFSCEMARLILGRYRLRPRMENLPRVRLDQLVARFVSPHFCFRPIVQTYQLWLDRWTPHTASRWIFTFLLIVAFMLRILLKQVILDTSVWRRSFLCFQVWQKALDDSTPFVKARWIGFALLTFVYLGRILWLQVVQPSEAIERQSRKAPIFLCLRHLNHCFERPHTKREDIVENFSMLFAS